MSRRLSPGPNEPAPSQSASVAGILEAAGAHLHPPAFHDTQIGRFVVELGKAGVMSAQAAKRLFLPPFEGRAFIEQIIKIGIQSLPIVALTAIFTSMVMTIQFGVQMQRFGAKAYVGNVVSLSLARELCPVLTALMVGGRVGAGIAAELGSMAVTEQIDAIRSLGADPIKKLVVPRVLAATFLLPLLTSLAFVMGIAAGAFIAQVDVGVGAIQFYHSSLRAVHFADFIGGIGKTAFFGYGIGIIACLQGFQTTGGTVGVGDATTRTVVITSVVTLVSDFILTKLFLVIGVG